MDMSFTAADIAGMLRDYAADREVEVDIHRIAAEIYGYTSGYPYLVSKICKLIDEAKASRHPAAGAKRTLLRQLRYS